MPGLPQAQLKKRAELKAQHPELNEQRQPERVMIPLDPPANEGGDPKPPEVREEPPEEVTTPTLEEQWRISSEKWENKFRSLQGTIESLEPSLRSEREKVGQLETELQKLRDAMPQPAPVLDPSEELSPEELEVYGGSAPVIEKIARKIAKGQLDSALKDLRKEIQELREADTRVQTDLAQTSEQQFLAHVKSVIKNFDGVTASNEWKEYLGSKVPYSRKTIYDSLSEAHEARDLDTIKEIFEGFKPSRSALAAMTSPALNGGAAPVDPRGGGKKPMLKLSDRKKMNDDFRMGRIKTKEQRAEWDKWKQIFDEADKEGRVDHNA